MLQAEIGGPILGRSGLGRVVDATGEIFGEVPNIAAQAQALAEAVTVPGTDRT